MCGASVWARRLHCKVRKVQGAYSSGLPYGRLREDTEKTQKRERLSIGRIFRIQITKEEGGRSQDERARGR